MSAKTQADYWKNKVFKLTYQTPGGEKREVSTYSVRVQFKGRREVIPTGEPNKIQAAIKARDIYYSLRSTGWEATLEKYKDPTSEKSDAVATVGDILTVVSEVSTVSQRTLAQYKAAFRKLAQDIAGIEDSKDKFSYVLSKTDKENGESLTGNQRWTATADKISLTLLTPEAILAWQKKRAEANRGNPEQQRKDRISAESILTRSRSLFGKKLIKTLKAKLNLPNPLPFDDERFKWKHSTRRFVQNVDPGELVGFANAELAKGPDEEDQDKTEVHKALLLCLYCGLRRAEADCLTWEQIDFKAQTLEIKETPYFKPKTFDSCRVVQLSDKLVSKLKALKKLSPSHCPFALQGGKAKPDSKHVYYRADLSPWRTWTKLINWLKKKNLRSAKPIHELRKMSGSLINQQHGIEAARNHLGHSDVSTTSKSYLETKRATVEI